MIEKPKSAETASADFFAGARDEREMMK